MRNLFSSILAPPEGTTFEKRGGYSDLILAGFVVLIIVAMILPLPLFVIDILVAINITVGFGLLLIALYIPTPVAFSSFPSVLLITTLFRLALSIAITRSILLNADAGHIVDTFGNMVAGGNLIVGLVVFLIITVVQFIVVAKGAERVAEVAARFTLDAMPGKQLSIDSDLRSGLIDKDEARRKRRLLEVESQLHGSLDGAMKFVKGDAIAGIVIIIINLLAGLGIGVLQHEMTMGDAVHTYSILTIGDGLVSQIPAILATISAGLIVTRTASDQDDKHLGESITRQISGKPRVMLIAGALSFLLACVPGFPWPVFVMLGIGLLATGAWRYRYEVELLRKIFRVSNEEVQESQKAEDTAELNPPAALKLDISPSLLINANKEDVRTQFNATAQRLRNEFGVPLPVPQLAVDPDLPDGYYVVTAHGARLASGSVRNDAYLSPARMGADPALKVAGFSPALAGAWTQAPAEGALSGLDVMYLHLSDSLKRRMGSFVGIQEASNLFMRMQKDYPDLVKEMLRVVAPQRVSDVLRRLVEEGVPIRNLRDAFEAITDVGGREKDVVLLTEYVRVALKREIADRYANADRTMHVLLIHPELEDKLRQSVRVAGGTSQLAISPELAGRLNAEVRAHLSRQPAEVKPVLLCSLDVRRHLRKLMEVDFFDLPVLSYQELASDLKIVQSGQINA